MLPAGVLTDTKVRVDGRFVSLKCLLEKKRGGINKAKRRKGRRKNGRKEEELKGKRWRKEGRKTRGKRKRPSILSFIYLFIHSYSLISHCGGNTELPYTLLLNSSFAQVIKNWYLLLTTTAAWLIQLWNPQVWEPLLGVALTPALREHTVCRPSLSPTPTPKTLLSTPLCALTPPDFLHRSLSLGSIRHYRNPSTRLSPHCTASSLNTLISVLFTLAYPGPGKIPRRGSE